MIKNIKYTQADKTELDIVVTSLGFRERNAILNKYIDVNRFIKNNDKDANPIDFLKEDVSILDFQCEVLEKCVNISVDDLEPTDGDNIFNENVDFMISGGTKN